MEIDYDLLNTLLELASGSVCFGFTMNAICELLGYGAFHMLQLINRLK